MCLYLQVKRKILEKSDSKIHKRKSKSFNMFGLASRILTQNHFLFIKKHRNKKLTRIALSPLQSISWKRWLQAHCYQQTNPEKVPGTSVWQQYYKCLREQNSIFSTVYLQIITLIFRQRYNCKSHDNIEVRF